MFEQEQQDAVRVVEEFLKQAKLKKGDLVVIGCSTSEIASHRIGSYSNADLGEAVFLAMQGAFAKEEISIATQCCEHLNRALIIERKDAERFGYEEVNVVPQPKAGGSFSTAAWKHMQDPVAVEHIQAKGGIFIHFFSAICTMCISHTYLCSAFKTHCLIIIQFTAAISAIHN